MLREPHAARNRQHSRTSTMIACNLHQHIMIYDHRLHRILMGLKRDASSDELTAPQTCESME